MANTKKSGNKRDAQAWAEMMSAWARSGLSQKAFCRKRGIPFSTFQYWRYQRKVRENGETRSPEPVSVPPPFLPVKVIQSQPVVETPEQALTVLLPSGYRIEVGTGFDPGMLRKIIDTLESRPC